MSIQRKEFARIIGKTLTARERLVSAPGGQAHSVAMVRGRLEITLQEVPPRQLGSLTLPQQRVSLRFCGVGREDIDDYLRRFARAYQRGGG